MIKYKTREEIELMRESALVVSRTLAEIAKHIKPGVTTLQLDKIAEASGHSILRTPQYHPELQPIETCWAIVKNYMADHCDFTMANFRKYLPRALEQVTKKSCKSLIKKVLIQEDKFWNEDEHLYRSNGG